MREYRRDLKAPREPEARDVGRSGAGDVATVVPDATTRRREEVRQEIEACGLARSVRADQRVDGAAAHAKAHVLDGDESAKLLGQSLGLEDDVARHVDCE